MAIEHRVAFAEVFDGEAPAHDEALHAAAAIRPNDRVLDIGCGTGHSTRAAARKAGAGRVLGVDISPGSIEHARHLTALAGLTNVSFEVADAQTHPFGTGEFDVCISRFGTMFFADPHAAFANLARSLRADGRLVVLVWQDAEYNEWFGAVGEALGDTGDPEPFSLGDPDTVRDVLRDFADVEFSVVHAPVRYGADAAIAYEFVLGFQGPAQTLAALDAADADAARARLRTMIEAHETDDGVLFDSRAWVISARRN